MGKTQHELILEGDPAALRTWYEDHVDALYGFIYYRVDKDREAAADLTQATFERALEKLGEFDSGRASMASWLRITSRNLIRDHMKTRQRLLWVEELWERIDDILANHLSGVAEQRIPDELIERKETRKLVSITLANLPAHYREVLTAKYLREESLKTIAAARNCTVKSVSSLLARARRAFQGVFLTLVDAEVTS